MNPTCKKILAAIDKNARALVRRTVRDNGRLVSDCGAFYSEAFYSEASCSGIASEYHCHHVSDLLSPLVDAPRYSRRYGSSLRIVQCDTRCFSRSFLNSRQSGNQCEFCTTGVCRSCTVDGLSKSRIGHCHARDERAVKGRIFPSPIQDRQLGACR